MKNLFNKLSIAIGFGCLSIASQAAFASVPEMDGDLIGQVGLLIAGVILVAKSLSKK